ncbi:hypothetical protein ACS0TY_009342 [Phlomoides rotata]
MDFLLICLLSNIVEGYALHGTYVMILGNIMTRGGRKYVDKARGKSKSVSKKRELDEAHGKSTIDSSDSGSHCGFIFNKGKRAAGNAHYSESEAMSDEHTTDKSNDREQKNKRRRKLSTNFLDNMLTEGKKRTSYRCNLRTCISELNDLRFDEEHLLQIRRTPIWLMFKAIYQSDTNKLMSRYPKYENNIRELMLAFDHNVDKFVVGPEIISLTSKDVQLIFGLSGGAKSIPLKLADYKVAPWFKRCFRKEIELLKGKFVLYKPTIYKKLKAVLEMRDCTSCLDAARLTHMYLLAAVLAPNQNASIAPHLAGYLEHFEEICDYDWCGYVVEMLIQQIKNTKNLKAGGCTMLLLFWFCEHTNLVRPWNEVGFPRFLKWDLNDLEKQLSRYKVTTLDGSYVNVKLKTTPREHQQFHALHSFWEKDQNQSQILPSIEGCPDTFGTYSNENEVSYAKQEPSPSNYETDDGVNATADLKDPSTSKQMSSRRKFETSLVVRSSENCDSTKEMPIRDKMGSCQVKKPRSSVLRHKNYSGGPQSRKAGNEVPVRTGLINEELNNIAQQLEEARQIDNTVIEETGIIADENEGVQVAVRYGLINEELNKSVQQLEEARQIISEKDNTLESFKEQLQNLETELSEKMKAAEKKYESSMKTEREKHEEEMKAKDRALESLKEELKNLETELSERMKAAEEKYKSEMKTEREKHEKEMKAKEEKCEREIKAEKEKHAREVMFEVEKHEMEMKAKDSQIELLRAGAVLLQNRVKSLTDPTLTQLYEYTDVDMREKTPVVTKHKSNRYPQPGSLAKRVKSRSTNEERKVVEITPQPSTREIIYIHENENQRVVKAEKESKQIFKMDESCDAVRKTEQRTKDTLNSYWKNDGPGKVVWLGMSALAHATVKDMLTILHHERFNDSIIDAWADILSIMYEETEFFHSTTIFPSICWDLVLRNKNEKTLKGMVDDKLDTVKNEDVLVFPLLVKQTKDGSVRGLGDHWTILILDLKQLQWSFYNSMRPRKGSVDNHLKGAFYMVEYVENKLGEIFKIKNPHHRFCRGLIKQPESVACLQQYPGTLDCGVIVCLQIELTLLRTQKKTGTLSKNKAAEYRARMVNWFVHAAEVVPSHPNV